MNYGAIQRKANDLLKSAGLKVGVERSGTAVTSGYGVFIEKSEAPDTSSSTSLLAPTPITKRVLLLSGLAKPPAVGDTVIADKVSYTVLAVTTTRPAATTLLYEVEVS